MNSDKHSIYIRRCFELAVLSGKKGYDTFGALIVHNETILQEAENTADYERGIFGHAEFNAVHKCANAYPDHVLRDAVLYTSCAPCERCLMAIASLGIREIVYGVSYAAFGLLLPFDPVIPDYESILKEMNVTIKLTGPILEDEGMKVFEYWGGNYRPLDELLAESAEMKKATASNK